MGIVTLDNDYGRNYQDAKQKAVQEIREKAADISLNGLFIRTEHKFGLSTILIIVIHLAEGQASRLKGKVMRVKKYGIGVEIAEKDSSNLHYYSRSFLNSDAGH